MKTSSRTLVAILLFSVVLTVGCGGSGQTTQTTPPANVNPAPSGADAVLGTWMVKGQSAMQYVLTFAPDGTYRMTYAGASSTGTYKMSGNSVSLLSGGGVSKKLTYVKAPDMQQDKLVETGGVTWTRI